MWPGDWNEVSKTACPAETRTHGNTTYINTFMMEWQFPASVPLTLATGSTGNSSMYCIRFESLHVKQQDRQQKSISIMKREQKK
jgi:hypothetical protein